MVCSALRQREMGKSIRPTSEVQTDRVRGHTYAMVSSLQASLTCPTSRQTRLTSMKSSRLKSCLPRRSALLHARLADCEEMAPWFLVAGTYTPLRPSSLQSHRDWDKDCGGIRLQRR